MLGVDDGLIHGKLDAADLCFLFALIAFVIAAIVRVVTKPIPVAEVLMLVGFALLSLAWLLL